MSKYRLKMVKTKIMSYTDRFTPAEALAANTPCGIKVIRRDIKEEIATLRSVQDSCKLLGLKEEAKLCFDEAVRLAKWLIEFGAFDEEEKK